MRSFLRFLRPMAYLRRQAIFRGLLGGSRKWMIWGGFAWTLHWLRRILGVGEPEPKLTEELAPGAGLVIYHEATSPLEQKKAARRARSASRSEARAAKRAR